jgi:RNAse (barnase) inhibitor barstar
MNTFASLAGPKVHVDQLDASAPRARKLIHSEPGEVVRVLRGSKMTTDAKLFDEVGAAFQFPSYFGENWNALRDCLGDLEWMPADRYIVVVTDVDAMLAQAPDLLEHLVVAFNEVANEWGQTANRPLPEPRAFHVVLRTRRSTSDLMALLLRAGVDFDQEPWPAESHA